MDLFLIRSKLNTVNIFRWPVLLGLIVGIIVLGYVGARIWKPEFFEKLPAALFKFLAEKKPVEEKLSETIAQEVPQTQASETGKYIEKAEKGEGTTHLARRALKKYLQENPQNFNLTPEHKIYIEDYLAKKINKPILMLGQEVEFSQDLIKEAIQKAQNLSPDQLKNLEQYSQLVPSLNY